MKLLSVIIPVYNTEKYLEKCLTSVLNCSFSKSIEIIVVDDNSPGNCKEIVEKFKTIKYIRHKKNEGLFKARLTGITSSSCNYIANLDSDDFIEPLIYEKAYYEIIKLKQDLIIFNVINFDDSSNTWIEPLNKIYSFRNLSGIDLLEEILLTNTNKWTLHSFCNKIIKKSIVEKVLTKINNKLVHLNLAEDLLWSICIYLELQNKSSICAIEDIGLNYYKNDNSITKRNTVSSLEKKILDTTYVINTIIQLLEDSNLYKKYKIHILQTKYVMIEYIFRKITFEFIMRKTYLFLKTSFFLKTTNKKKIDKYLIENSSILILQKIITNNITELSIFGLGELTSSLYNKLKDNNIKINSIILSKTSKEKSFKDIPIYTLEETKELNIKTYCIASIRSYFEIKSQIKKNNKNITIIGMFN